MPKDFTNCVNKGGKVVTLTPNKKSFMRVCYDKKGKSHAGEVKKRMKKETEIQEKCKKKTTTENESDFYDFLVGKTERNDT